MAGASGAPEQTVATSAGRARAAGTAAVLLVLTAAAAGAGGAVGLHLHAVLEQAARKISEVPQPAVSGAKAGSPASMRLKPLAPIITNLGDPQRAWVRLEASLVLEGEPLGDTEVLAARVAEDIVAFLRSVSLAQFQGASGFQHLREDLSERARLRGAGRVSDLVIHGFIVE